MHEQLCQCLASMRECMSSCSQYTCNLTEAQILIKQLCQCLASMHAQLCQCLASMHECMSSCSQYKCIRSIDPHSAHE